jgi:DNA mismatch repair ATPase MutS
MKVRLMNPDAPFDPEAELPDNVGDLTADLGLGPLLNTMAAGDRFLWDMSRAALFQPVTETETIRYRQEVLADCLAHRDIIERLYALGVEAVEVEKQVWVGWNATSPSRRLSRSRQVMVGYVKLLRQLRTEADQHASEFTSRGLSALCESASKELDDDYLDTVDEYLARLQFYTGTVETARLGPANAGTGYVLRTPERAKPRLRDMFVWDWASARYTVTVPDRDMAGTEQLVEMREHGFARAAEALGQSADHVKEFFFGLRRELGFYLACANLAEVLEEAGQPMCVPDPRPVEDPGLTAHGLYDPLLVVHGEQRPTGSDIDASASSMVVITGANQGGKSTFLRALGCAQLMMQAGTFVAARAFTGAVAAGIHTHFKREEDETMVMGKFDEELFRMSRIVDRVQPGALVLCNESLSSTNEREAAIVGGDIVEGLLECGIRVHLVTHMYAFGHRLASDIPGATCLRANRLDDGTRTFEIVPGEPAPTSYAEDLYREVFGHPLEPAAT